MNAPGIDRRTLKAVKSREDAAFAQARPRSLALWERAKPVMPNGVPMSWLRTSYDHPPLFVDEGHGARFRDVDGHEYADFNIADMSVFAGHAPEPVVEAVARRAAMGTQFMLPNEDGIWVAEELARRYGLPKWQFTLSATHANTEAIRVARVATGRDKVLFFDGKYHGHFDEAMIELADGRLVPEEAGLPDDATTRTAIVQWNDVEALRAALASREIAIVITEPVMTNNVGLLLPQEGFHEQLRAITRETGTLLAYDETHTQVVGPGGLTRSVGAEPDVVTIGKSLAGGVPLGAYGMTESVAEVLERPGRARRREGHGGDRRHALRQPALHGGGPRHDGRGPDARGLCPHAATGDPPRRRHREDRGGGRAPLDHAPVLAPERPHVRAADAARRAGGRAGVWTCRCAA